MRAEVIGEPRADNGQRWLVQCEDGIQRYLPRDTAPRSIAVGQVAEVELQQGPGWGFWKWATK